MIDSTDNGKGDATRPSVRVNWDRGYRRAFCKKLSKTASYGVKTEEKPPQNDRNL
jgi:hypothetical protein